MLPRPQLFPQGPMMQTKQRFLNLFLERLQLVSSVAQLCLTLYDLLNCRMPGLPVHLQLPEPTQTHVHWVGDAIQPSHPLSSPSPPAFNCCQHRDFSNESARHTRWPKFWSFSFSISPSNEYSGLISFRMDWLDLLAVQGTLKSLLQHYSSKASILLHSAFFIVQLSRPYMTIGKAKALTRWTYVGKVMSLLFNALSRFVIAFLPRIKPPNFMAAVTIHSDFGAQENKVCHCFPIYMPWSNGTRCHDLSFWMLSLKPAFSLSSFTFIKRLFSCFLLSAIRVVSSAYLRLLIFLPAILIPICSSFSLAFLIIYSAYELNKQGDNIQPWCTPFPMLNQCVVPCSVPTVASRPAYRFHRRQVWLSGKKGLLREPKMIFIRKYFINHKSLDLSVWSVDTSGLWNPCRVSQRSKQSL